MPAVKKVAGRKTVKKSSIRKSPSRSGEPNRLRTLRSRFFIPLGIFGLALVVRLIYLFQIESIPLFYHPAGDGRGYDEWAQRIAAGDWWGQDIFYQAPLYPYFLGLLQFVLGHDLWSVRLIQITLGAFSCVLLYWAGTSFFSRRAGIAAGLILSLYGPGIFFDALIQKAVLDLLLISLLLFSLSRIESGSRGALWIAVGTLVGLLSLSRENALIWIPVVAVWIWIRFSADAFHRFKWLVMFLLGVVLVLFPVGLRNLIAGGEFTLTTSQLGPNFFIGNNPEADGTYMPLRAGHGDPQFERQDATELAEQALGRPLSAGEVSSYWSRRSSEYIRSEPLDWLRLMARKWLMLWSVREFEDTDDFYLYEQWSWVLYLLGSVNHFGVLAPLAAVGIVLTWKQRHEFWLLYLLLVTLAFSIVLFYVFGRYRFSLVPIIVLFSGAGLAQGFELYKNRNTRQTATSAVIGLLVAAVVNWPIFGWPAPSAAGYHNVGNALVKQGKVDQAIDNYQQALKILPTYASAHYSLGNSFAQLGQFDRAISHYQEAIILNPDFAEAYNNVGNVLALRGDLDGAIREFRKALELAPNSSEIHLNLGTALARKGKFDEAIARFRQGLKIKPDSVRLRYSLGTVLAAQGHFDDAAEQFRETLRIQPDFVPARESLKQLGAG